MSNSDTELIEFFWLFIEEKLIHQPKALQKLALLRGLTVLEKIARRLGFVLPQPQGTPMAATQTPPAGVSAIPDKLSTEAYLEYCKALAEDGSDALSRLNRDEAIAELKTLQAQIEGGGDKELAITDRRHLKNLRSWFLTDEMVADDKTYSEETIKNLLQKTADFYLDFLEEKRDQAGRLAKFSEMENLSDQRKRDNDRLTADCKKLQREKENLAAELRALQKTFADNEETLKEIGRSASGLTTEIVALRGEHGKLSDEHKALKAQYDDLKATSQAELNRLQQEKDALAVEAVKVTGLEKRLKVETELKIAIQQLSVSRGVKIQEATALIQQLTAALKGGKA